VEISRNGGRSAELFYIALDGKLMATSIKPAADHQSIDIGPPVPLFVAQSGAVVRPNRPGNYMPSADGQRFLVNRLLRDAGGTTLRVVLHWVPAK